MIVLCSVKIDERVKFKTSQPATVNEKRDNANSVDNIPVYSTRVSSKRGAKTEKLQKKMLLPRTYVPVVAATRRQTKRTQNNISQSFEEELLLIEFALFCLRDHS